MQEQTKQTSTRALPPNLGVIEGSEWEDRDLRNAIEGRPRRVRVVSVGAVSAVVENVETKKRSTIALRRFDGRSKNLKRVPTDS